MDFRLHYCDTDAVGIVYYAAYYPWFERVFTEWTFENGIPFEVWEEKFNALQVAVASGCNYRKPALVLDPFTVRMRSGNLGVSSYRMDFSVDHRETNETYADGHMTFACIRSKENPESVPVPSELAALLKES
tara:strand:+ start:1426 stop:1821 length:396 start_codon:yes stop_codon:yes gene_type:complete